MHRASQWAGQFAQEVLRRCDAAKVSGIVETMGNGRAPLHSLAEAITAAPAFAGRLVCLANLASGAAPRLTTVAQATSALGWENLKPLLLGLLAYEAKAPPRTRMQETLDTDPMTQGDLSEHAVVSAVIAAKLAAKLTDVAPLQAFIAGLIHDIGRLLLWRYAGAEFAAAVALACDRRLPIREAEARTLGIDHAAMGEAWCRKCEIAAPLAAVVRRHHDSITTLTAAGAADEVRLISIIQASESLAGKTPVGGIDEDVPAHSDVWSALGLGSKADWADTARAVQSQVESRREAFGSSRCDRVRPAFAARDIAQAAPALPVSTASRASANRAQVIRLPMSTATARRRQARPAAAKLVVLVVADHGSLCDRIRMFLTRYGYQVRTASNEVSALEILADEAIHMVLLDLMLPQVDGFAVLRQIQKSRQEILPYIVAVCAAASERDRSNLLDLGANEYMAKPFKLARLLERVQAVEKYLL